MYMWLWQPILINPFIHLYALYIAYFYLFIFTSLFTSLIYFIMSIEISGNKLLLDGFIYFRSKIHKSKIYWECRRLRLNRDCNARAITNDPAPGEPVHIIKGSTESPHSHPPNHDIATTNHGHDQPRTTEPPSCE